MSRLTNSPIAQLAISLSQIAFDTYVIVLTVKKTANYTTGMRRLTGNERSLSQVLLRDGQYYSPTSINDISTKYLYWITGMYYYTCVFYKIYLVSCLRIRTDG